LRAGGEQVLESAQSIASDLARFENSACNLRAALLVLKRFSVGLQQDQVRDEHHAVGKYLLVPWGGQVLTRCVVAQT
jgi:predicted transcriptional regulator of viral defense system